MPTPVRAESGHQPSSATWASGRRPGEIRSSQDSSPRRIKESFRTSSLGMTHDSPDTGSSVSTSPVHVVERNICCPLQGHQVVRPSMVGH